MHEVHCVLHYWLVSLEMNKRGCCKYFFSVPRKCGQIRTSGYYFGKQLVFENETNDADISHLVPSANCHILKAMPLNFKACFGSTYLSESGFCLMKI
jgi:hypothetical protein